MDGINAAFVELRHSYLHSLKSSILHRHSNSIAESSLRSLGRPYNFMHFSGELGVVCQKGNVKIWPARSDALFSFMGWIAVAIISAAVNDIMFKRNRRLVQHFFARYFVCHFSSFSYCDASSSVLQFVPTFVSLPRKLLTRRRKPWCLRSVTSMLEVRDVPVSQTFQYPHTHKKFLGHLQSAIVRMATTMTWKQGEMMLDSDQHQGIL